MWEVTGSSSIHISSHTSEFLQYSTRYSVNPFNSEPYLGMPFETSLSEVSTTAQIAFAAEQFCELSLHYLLNTGSAILESVLAAIRAPSTGGPAPGDIC